MQKKTWRCLQIRLLCSRVGIAWGQACSELVPRVGWVSLRTPKSRGGILGTSPWTLRARCWAGHCPDQQGDHGVGPRGTSPSIPKNTHHLPRLAARSSSHTEPGFLPAPSRASAPHSCSPAALPPAPDSEALGPVRCSPRASLGTPFGSRTLALGPHVQKATQPAQMTLPGWYVEYRPSRAPEPEPLEGSSYRSFL